MHLHVKLNFSKFNKKVHLLVSEQYIDRIMHGATIKVAILVQIYLGEQVFILIPW